MLANFGIGTLAWLAATCAPAPADPVEDFYRGRNVTMVIEIGRAHV